MNDSGEVTGSLQIPGPVSPYRAFLYSGGVTINLGALPGHNWSEGYGIAESGTVCGFSMNSISGPANAVYWQDGVITALELPIGPTSIANDISDNDRICGWMGLAPGFGAHGFIYDVKTQQVIDLVPPPGTLGYDPRGINNHDDVCGIVRYPPVPPDFVLRHAFLWSDGAMIDLGVLPGFDDSLAFALNDSKVVIGYCEVEGDGNQPFVWRNGIMHKLNDLIPEEFNIDVITPWDINNAGQIAADGLDLATLDQIGLRLTPLPSPVGDFNCDTIIDVDDLLGVINTWADTPMKGSTALPPADFNQDSIVDHEDLMIVLDNWTI
jgi:uncharacterized membrane protein